MIDLNTILGYPIARGDDGQLYYVAYTVDGQPYGWRVSYIDHLRHHHAHHAHARRASHPVHHHASHHSRHHQVVALSHRRTVAPPLHHAAVAHPAVQVGTGRSSSLKSSNAEASGIYDQEENMWNEFHERHARRIMALQGAVDVAAGGAGVVTTVALVSLLLAPETAGASVAVGVALLAVYGIFRGFSQMGAGLVEVITAAQGSDKEVKETGEELERFKTLTAISAYGSLASDRFAYHRPLNWKRAGYFSDGETVIGGVLQAKPGDEAVELMKLAPKLQTAVTVGGLADKADQTHVLQGDAIHGVAAAARYLRQQKQKREQQQQTARPLAPTAPASGARP
jgi:hypothetical protein